MHVERAARVVRREAVEVRRFGIVEAAFRHAHVDLIRLLVVLMGEEIGRACARQRVVGEQFQTVGQFDLAEKLHQQFHRIHIFHHAAKLGAVGRAAAVLQLGVMLVAGISARDLAEPLLAPLDPFERRLAIALFRFHFINQRGQLADPGDDHVVLFVFLIRKIEERIGYRVGEAGFVFEGFENRRIAGHVVEPETDVDQIGGCALRPPFELAFEFSPSRVEFFHPLDDSLVAGRLIVFEEAAELPRTQVEDGVLLRRVVAQESGILGEGFFDRFRRPLQKDFVASQIGEGDDPFLIDPALIGDFRFDARLRDGFEAAVEGFWYPKDAASGRRLRFAIAFSAIRPARCSRREAESSFCPSRAADSRNNWLSPATRPLRRPPSST